MHDLRRTIRTGLAKLGVRPDIAERYLEEKRDALTQWADHLQALTGGK
jgi:hypothetical protein